jgi:hypothetical protein
VSDYEHVGHRLKIARSRGREHPFMFDAEWQDITPRGADRTTWRLRQKEGAGPACSFVVTVTGRTAQTFDHPMPVSLALKLAMLMAIRHELSHLGPAIQTGAVIVEDHPVVVTEAHLAAGVRMAYGPGRSTRSS